MFPFALAVLLQLQTKAQTVQERLFQALSKTENCIVWKNPGCLKFAKQPGAKRGPRGYAVFATLKQGEAALRRRITSRTGMTVGEFLKGFNPGRASYAKRVLSFADLNLEDRL